jgi:tetratricopeptide (TPR) repeat protein
MGMPKKIIPTPEGAVLRFFRDAKAVSEGELASLNGVSIQTIRRWERNTPLDAGRLAEVLLKIGVPPEAVETALLAHRLGNPPPEPGMLAAPSGERQRLVHRAAAAGGRSGAEAARTELTRLCSLEEAPHHRRWAADVWSRMKKLTDKEQALIANAAAHDDRSWALAERLCLASEAMAAHRADESLRLARLGLGIAEQSRLEGRSRLRLAGWCEPFVGNSLRVGGDLKAAEEAFAHADELWKKGDGGDLSGILNGTRRLDLKASLLRQLGKFEEALSLIDRALAESPPEATAPLLFKKAATHSRAGEFERAIAVLHQAEPWIDGRREPRHPFLHSFSVASNLCRLESYDAAAALLPKLRLLAAELRNELDGWRTVWLSAQISAGLGRREEAIAALSNVREYFDSEHIPYDFALASLELAILYLEQGLSRRVRELADEMIWIFRDQRVHKEALAAISLFCQAASLDMAEAKWTRRLVNYLYQAENNPIARFEG